MLTHHIAVRSCCTFVTRALFSATRLSFYKRPNFQTTLTVLNFKGKPITIPDINRSRACTDISISAISFKKLCIGEVKFLQIPLLRWRGERDSNLKEKRGIPLFSRLLAITTHQQPKVELFIFILFFDYFRQTKNLSTLTGG